jgi:hypothetical protein
MTSIRAISACIGSKESTRRPSGNHAGLDRLLPLTRSPGVDSLDRLIALEIGSHFAVCEGEMTVGSEVIE